jgi:hypothetical protein
MTRPVDFKNTETFVPADSSPESASHCFLFDIGLAKRTRNSYRKAVLQFLAWCDLHDLEAEDFDVLDQQVTTYMHHVYMENEGKCRQQCANTIFGIQCLMPESRGKLLRAAHCLKQWEKAHPSVPYPPLTWALTCLLAVQMVRAGFYRFGVATLLGFDCLLRINELLSLRVDDVTDLREWREREYREMSVRLAKAKTGVNQSVDILDPKVKALVLSLAGRTKCGALLFPGGENEYRRVFKACCASLGLSSSYVPHSLRHGGATRLFLQGWSVDRIMIRGRWKESKSARRYIQSSKAVAIATTVPTHIQPLADAVSKDVESAFAQAQKH